MRSKRSFQDLLISKYKKKKQNNNYKLRVSITVNKRWFCFILKRIRNFLPNLSFNI